MSWEYRNIQPGRTPPCPVCNDDRQVERPSNGNGKYRCLKTGCGATFQARWIQEAADGRTAHAAPGEGDG